MILQFYFVIFSNGYNNSSEIVLYNTDSRLISITTTSYYTTCYATFTSTNFKLSEITSVGYTGFTVTNVYGIRKINNELVKVKRYSASGSAKANTYLDINVDISNISNKYLFISYYIETVIGTSSTVKITFAHHINSNTIRVLSTVDQTINITATYILYKLI